MTRRTPAVALVLAAAAAAAAAAPPFPVPLPAELGGRIADTRRVLPGDLSAFFTVHLDALSPADDIAGLARVLAGQGPNAAAAALAELPVRGWLAIGNDLRYDIRLARSAFGDGSWTVQLVTAQPIQVGDALALPYRDYPYGLVDLHLDGDGEGDGELYLAANVTFREDGTLAADPYPAPPLRVLSLHPTEAQNR